MWHDENNKIIKLIAVHVDDFLCTSKSLFLETILGKLRKSFSIGNKEQECFHFLGLNIKLQNNEILLDQNHYKNNISKVLISPSHRTDFLILFNSIQFNFFLQKK